MLGTLEPDDEALLRSLVRMDYRKQLRGLRKLKQRRDDVEAQKIARQKEEKAARLMRIYRQLGGYPSNITNRGES